MTDSFAELREILETGNIPGDMSHFLEPFQRRLLNALHDSPKSGDIASLLRDVLRREDEKQGARSQTLLRVQKRSPFPEGNIWKQAGISLLAEEPNHYLISANPWQPEWLDFSSKYPPEVPLYKQENRRSYEPVIGDPFLELVELKTYRSIGQREAIRAILTAPPKSTLTVNLPTGSGKSLCAQLPALSESQIAGVSIVVVPTTSLAIDQERALRPLIKHDTAYYSDKSLQGHNKREEIRRRIRAGTQRIIFTSPESLIESLASSLYEAANLGLLRYFIIDEAHIVEQWGDDFRTAFQELSGIRRDLLRRTPFTTLLLTATLTASCLDTLETLFGSPGEFQVISAVQLRPEPGYWFAYCENEEIRKQRLIEAVYHLPRPLIIYCTKVSDVKDWARELRRAGFKRYDVMTGESTPEQRLQLIQNWREGKVDIVIATSAFGLGVDQSDVRTIIHVCIPENIDRFYQEVGRSGRDGKASISLTLYTRGDLDVAKGINEKSTITIERGIQRWQSMFNRKISVPGKGFRLPINIPPSFREGDIDMNSTQNTAWNIHTLILMSRAGLIEMDSEEPPRRKDFESQSEEAYSKALENYRNSRLIHIRNEYHLKPEIWESLVEPIRKERQKWSQKNLQLMTEALRTKRCISEIFAEAYTISESYSGNTRPVKVSRACGGCPVCRKNGVTPFPGIMPISKPVWHETKLFLGTELQRLFAGDNLMLIFYESLQQLSKMQRGRKLFKWLIDQGMKNIVIPLEQQQFIQEVRRIQNTFFFLFENYEPIQMPHIPTLIFHPPGRSLPYRYLSNNNIQRIILVPVNTLDPNREDRLLINIFSGRQFKFDTFCTEISI
ncbi:DEAD/DEAH box helicase [Aetokthonos hydrillicola Thurmond2011]|jgi:RecQ family ATP-dependent DNA helicase|uniref:DNA 3'-5' helicase n=1 Tax=Aetokthonos hydrillicola Thurmond2011 TaxID=2712845 RepID=A0AAP5MBP7_9CYAN|nr:protein DpdF [Aetokthonos hydrillicola]MBO3457750.1 ATP-dependent DNA helicase RecQ [Aetokthonos hydrillicola CCALA 1050]MBW4589399.1 DEAD/DEAH box helicase [Aetokthonos hydrillicola CCALA 1050]MDR9897124.1 DEAD/DEAH box helicase [Aetokthonos hydrillicola Thurmond2011]